MGLGIVTGPSEGCMPGTRDEGRKEAGGWEDSGGRRGDLTQVPSEAVTSGEMTRSVSCMTRRGSSGQLLPE